MEQLLDGILSKFVKYAFYIGLVLGILCMLFSYGLDANSRLGSLLINLAGDFFMAGLTISVVDKLIKRSERQKFGILPEVAKKAINREIWSLIGLLSYTLSDAISKTTEEIIGSGIFDDGSGNNDILENMHIMGLAQLKVIDENKLTYGMFSEMLRFIRQALAEIDNLIARYGLVLDSEEISRAIALRDKLENLGNAHTLSTLTIPFFGQQTPLKLLDNRQRPAFMAIKDGIIELADSL